MSPGRTSGLRGDGGVREMGVWQWAMCGLLGYDLLLSVAENHGAGRGQGAEGVHALLGAVLLPEADADVEDNDEGEDAALDVV